jgi:hypothetical protein
MAMTWMIVWAVLGYIFAPYGMWKHHRAQTANVSQPDQKQARELVGKNRVDRFRP